MPLKENNFSMEGTYQIIQNLMKKMVWKQIPVLMEKTDPLALIFCCYKLAELHWGHLYSYRADRSLVFTILAERIWSQINSWFNFTEYIVMYMTHYHYGKRFKWRANANEM